MRFSIRDDKEPVQEMRFYLEVNSEDTITVRAVDHKGIDWNIVTIQPRGVTRYSVGGSGFTTDIAGRLQDVTL